MLEKLKESGFAILILITIVGIIFATGIAPFDATIFINFIICSIMVVFGQMIFLSGADNSILLMGKHSGSALMKLKKVWLILIFAGVFGFITTIAEPDVQVLAQFVGTGGNMSAIFVVVVGLGIGIFTLIAFTRILKNISMQLILVLSYVLVVVISLFVGEEFFALSFDAGGMTTGAITVPFLLSLTIGLCSVRSVNKKEDNFGVAAIATSGAVISVLIMSFFFKNQTLAISIDSGSIGQVLVDSLIKVGIVLSPILAIFIIMQIFLFKFPKKYLAKIIFNYFFSGLGLALFLTGVVAGFAPMGEHLGLSISSPFILILLSLVFGAILVLTEPSIKILLKEIEAVSFGLIKRKYVFITLAVSVALSLVLSTLRIIFDLSLWWFMIPMIILALILTFFTPKIFFTIAFDSGGIVTGTILVSFVFPFFMGLSQATYFTNLNALGVISLSALLPIIGIEILGIIYSIVEKKHKVTYEKEMEKKEEEKKLLSYSKSHDDEDEEIIEKPKTKGVKEEKWKQVY